MKLKRISKNRQHEHEAIADNFQYFAPKTVFAKIGSFGTGSEKTSDFHPYFRWEDVESLINAFAELREPKAVRALKALALATALQELASTPMPESD